MDESRLPAASDQPATFGQRVVGFFLHVERPRITTPGFDIMDPYQSADVQAALQTFCATFYGDHRQRLLILGINPGRFGGGITGISFTDPWALHNLCGIHTSITGQRELSSEFIYAMIDRYGGPPAFFQDCFLSAVLPFGLLRGKLNVNYYDDRALMSELTCYILRTLRMQIDFGVRRDIAIVLGTGKNLDFLTRLNNEHALFGRLVALDHPRFVMQYRRKRLDEYLDRYVETIRTAVTQP
jgi:hypothetical protein